MVALPPSRLVEADLDKRLSACAVAAAADTVGDSRRDGAGAAALTSEGTCRLEFCSGVTLRGALVFVFVADALVNTGEEAGCMGVLVIPRWGMVTAAPAGRSPAGIITFTLVGAILGGKGVVFRIEEDGVGRSTA